MNDDSARTGTSLNKTSKRDYLYGAGQLHKNKRFLITVSETNRKKVYLLCNKLYLQPGKNS